MTVKTVPLKPKEESTTMGISLPISIARWLREQKRLTGHTISAIVSYCVYEQRKVVDGAESPESTIELQKIIDDEFDEDDFIME